MKGYLILLWRLAAAVVAIFSAASPCYAEAMYVPQRTHMIGADLVAVIKIERVIDHYKSDRKYERDGMGRFVSVDKPSGGIVIKEQPQKLYDKVAYATIEKSIHGSGNKILILGEKGFAACGGPTNLEVGRALVFLKKANLDKIVGEMQLKDDLSNAYYERVAGGIRYIGNDSSTRWQGKNISLGDLEQELNDYYQFWDKVKTFPPYWQTLLNSKILDDGTVSTNSPEYKAFLDAQNNGRADLDFLNRAQPYSHGAGWVYILLVRFQQEPREAWNFLEKCRPSGVRFTMRSKGRDTTLSDTFAKDMILSNMPFFGFSIPKNEKQ